MRSLRPRAILLVVVSSLAFAGVASASHSLVDRVKDGPAATATRESYRCLELGEASEEDATKLDWYRRGKEFADTAVREDERSAEAHFALRSSKASPAPSAAPTISSSRSVRRRSTSKRSPVNRLCFRSPSPAAGSPSAPA